jgi:hypothetical protein
MSASESWKSDEVAAAIRASWKMKGFIWFNELRVGTGYGSGRERKIDLWGICEHPSNAKRTVAVEIKTSRSDFRREIINPQKRRGALLHSNQFYFAAPKGMLSGADLPPECGLIEVVRTGCGPHAEIAVDAPFEERFPPDWAFVASICRQLSRIEAAHD